MSWFSSALSWVGNTAKSTVKAFSGYVGSIAAPIVSSIVKEVPVIGGVASKFVDAIGNKVATQFDEPEANGIDAMVEATQANNNNFTISQPTVNAPAPQNFLGIGGSSAGILGIGDGKKGILGIGTGKNKAKKAAIKAVLAAGGTQAEAEAAGARAAAEVEKNGIPSKAAVKKAARNAVLLGGGTTAQADAAAEDAGNDYDEEAANPGSTKDDSSMTVVALIAAAAAAIAML